MSQVRQRRKIEISEDDVAVYTVLAQIEVNGEVKERPLETKPVHVSALFRPNGASTVLPSGCRFVREEGPVSVFVIQREPRIIQIEWGLSNIAAFNNLIPALQRSGAHRLRGETSAEFAERLRTQRIFRLAFPYIVMVFRFEHGEFARVHLWFRNKPLRRDDDELLVPNLPNREQGTGRMCLTNEIHNLTSGGRSIAEIIEIVEKEIWSSRWNDHWSQEVEAYMQSLPELLPWTWEQESLRNSQFALGVKWRSGERTVGQEMYSLLRANMGGEARAKRWFDQAAQAIRQAEAWAGTQVTSTPGFEASPAEWLDFSGVSLAIGDTLECTTNLFGILRSGERYQIEAFGRNHDGDRLIKLRGVDKAVPLIVRNRLNQGVRLVANSEQVPIYLSGMLVNVGALCCFRKNQEWPGRDLNHWYKIDRVKRDPEGYVLAKFTGEPLYTVLGKDDQAFPGIRIRTQLPLAPNGRELLAQEFVCTDGNVLCVGQYVVQRTNEGVYLYQIRAFCPLMNGEDRYTYYPMTGNRVHFESDTGGLRPGLTLLPQIILKEEVRINNRVLKIGDQVAIHETNFASVCQLAVDPEEKWVFAQLRGRDTWSVLADNGELEQGVRLRFAARLVDGELKFGGNGVKLREDDWIMHKVYGDLLQIRALTTRPNGDVVARVGEKEKEEVITIVQEQKADGYWLPAYMEYKHGKVTLKRGQVLRLRQVIRGADKGETYVISHVVMRGNANPCVVTSRGQIFLVNDYNLSLFDTRLEKKWQPLLPNIRHPLAKPQQIHVALKNLRLRARAWYIGGDNECLNWNGLAQSETRAKVEAAACTIPVTILHRENQEARVVFDPAPNDPVWFGLYGQDRHITYIRKRFLREIIGSVLTDEGFGWMPVMRRGYWRFGNSQGKKYSCQAQGRNGEEIKVGDLVRVSSSANDGGYWSGTSPQARNACSSGRALRVVHLSRVGGLFSYDWLCLDVAENVGRRPSDRIPGFYNLNYNYPEANDESWWCRVVIVKAICCERVTRRGER